MAEAGGSDTGKPKVLVLGGCGFIGRNFVKYLVDNDLASFIRVADKSMPGISYFSDEIKAVFADKEKVQFSQCDLSKDAHVDKAFKDHEFDFVFNLCGETRFGLNEQDYNVKNVTTATKTAAKAATLGVKKYVEISTAHVYAATKDAADEDAKIDPWTTVAKYRFDAEQAVANTDGLNYVILRPAIVYGPYDLTGLTPRLMCAAVYKVLDEKIKFLWTESLKINCVHVLDVVRAMWAAREFENGKVYNLADQSNLDQGKFNRIIAEIFGIKTGFQGTIASKIAKTALTTVAEISNNKHVPTFSKLCQDHGILNTPLTPYLDKELLRDNHLSINGTKITSETGFEYQCPQISTEIVREILTQFIDQKLFPPII